MRVGGDVSFVEGRVQKPHPIHRSQLVISNSSRGVSEIAVELPRLYTQHIIRRRSVTSQTIGRAGIVPALRAKPGGVRDDNVFAQTGGQQVGVRIVGPPL